MGRKSKFTQLDKLNMVHEYLDLGLSANSISKKYGCDSRYLRYLAVLYNSLGEEAFKENNKNKSYTKEFKQKVVNEYLKGEKGLRNLAVEYKIYTYSLIRCWVKMYNGHKELESYKAGGGNEMTKGRRTTYEERIEILEYYIKNGQNYSLTATEYKVSYQQVYNWVKKYNDKGIVGLKDNRGKGKDIEDMNKVEQLEAENKLLKARLERMEIEIELKKKLEELQIHLESTTRKRI